MIIGHIAPMHVQILAINIIWSKKTLSSYYMQAKGKVKRHLKLDYKYEI